MYAWKQIQQSVDYIENHITEDIRIEELAKIAALSPFYFQRLFSRLVKKPVNEYIKLRRMALATKLLLEKDTRILDIALELGFSSHELFTRTFKDTFQITPEEYRKNPVTVNRMTKPQLLLNYTLINENVPLISDGIVLEISRKVLEKPEYYIGLKEKAPIELMAGLGVESGVDPLDNVWKMFHNNKLNIKSLIPNGDEIGIAYPSLEEGYFSYFAGGKASSNLPVEGYENWELVAGEYIVCSFEAENFEQLVMDTLYKAQRYLYEVWLPNYNITTEAFSIERYESHESDTTKMEIWVKPI